MQIKSNFLTVQEVAELIGSHQSKVYADIATRKLAYVGKGKNGKLIERKTANQYKRNHIKRQKYLAELHAKRNSR